MDGGASVTTSSGGTPATRALARSWRAPAASPSVASLSVASPCHARWPRRACCLARSSRAAQPQPTSRSSRRPASRPTRSRAPGATRTSNGGGSFRRWGSPSTTSRATPRPGEADYSATVRLRLDADFGLNGHPRRRAAGRRDRLQHRWRLALHPGAARGAHRSDVARTSRGGTSPAGGSASGSAAST